MAALAVQPWLVAPRRRGEPAAGAGGRAAGAAGGRAARHARGRPRRPRHRHGGRPGPARHRDGRQDRDRAGAPHLQGRPGAGRHKRKDIALGRARPRAVRLLRALSPSRAIAVAVVVEHGMSGAKAASPDRARHHAQDARADPGRGRPQTVAAAAGGADVSARPRARLRAVELSLAEKLRLLHWPLVALLAGARACRLRHALLGRRRLARALGLAARRAAGRRPAADGRDRPGRPALLVPAVLSCSTARSWRCWSPSTCWARSTRARSAGSISACSSSSRRS